MPDKVITAIANDQITEDNISFNLIRQIAGNENDSAVWRSLGYGRNILTSSEQLNQYLYSYGPMIQSQWVQICEGLNVDEGNITLLDYGCGQGLASLLLLDCIQEEFRYDVSQVILIEPSEVALNRAEQVVQICYPNAEIRRVCRNFDSVSNGDLQTNDDDIKIHFHYLQYQRKEGVFFAMSNARETLDFEQKHKEDLQRLRGFRLLDDDFMSKVFEDKACAEFLLQIILQRHDLKVQSVQGQYDIKNLQGRSIRLDILAVDSNNRIYNIEIQRSDRGADAKRARYNSSLIDANITEAGDKYDALTETYVIFITENDVLKAGLPIYHVDRIIQETGEPFGDEAHIIYINSQIKDETELGKLMHDFSCTNPKDMYYKILADRVRYFKEDEEGVLTMCREMENMRKAERIEIAKRMLASGKLTYEDIAAFTDLTLEEIEALAVQKTA